MITANEYYKYAQLATAAYVDLTLEPNLADQARLATIADAQARVPQPLSGQFFDPATGWRVLGDPRHYVLVEGGAPHVLHDDPSSGFAATLFQNAQTGEKVLAIRGTDPARDFPEQAWWDLFQADLMDIGRIGVAVSQVVSLFNLVQRLMTPYGAAATQLRLRESGLPSANSVLGGNGKFYSLERIADAIGQGVIAEGQGLKVVGHSLGGHLAAMAQRLFPTIFSGAVVFNSAGHDPITSTRRTRAFLELFRPFGANPAAGFSNIESAISEDAVPGSDIAIVPNSFITGTRYGVDVNVTTELNSHVIEPFMDSLSTQSLISSMNGELSMDDLGKILQAASADAKTSDEQLVRNLYAILNGGTTQLETFSASLISAGDVAARRLYYTHIRLLEDIVAGNAGLALESLAEASAAQLLGAAQLPSRVSMRHALLELTPFAVVGLDLAERFPNGELDLFVASDGTGTLTSQWLERRAEMLGAKLERNRADVALAYRTGSENWRYEDRRLDETVFVVGGDYQSTVPPLSFPSAVERFLNQTLTHQVFFDADQGSSDGGNLLGRKYDDWLFAGTGNDVLQGLEGNDYLEGGADIDKLLAGSGDDILFGGEGDDKLSGGRGNDTYRWSPGDGFDEISDTAEAGVRAGKIEFAGLDLAGDKALKFPDNDKLFTDAAGNLYAFQGELGRDGVLTIVPASGQGGVRILGFKSGDFGITLNAQGYTPAPPANVFGTSADDNFYSSDADAVASLSSTAATQNVFGQDGDDRIFLRHAGVAAYGEAGDDLLTANDLDDQELSGGQGNDILLDDRGAASLYGGVGDDVLQGGRDDDYLVGGPDAVSAPDTDHDLIDGGIGADVIFGGAGDDLLVGGGNLAPIAGLITFDHAGELFGWRPVGGVMTLFNMAGYWRDVANPFTDHNGELGLAAADGYFMVEGDLADFIDGGSGKDLVLAGLGDDIVFGGDDDDRLIGQAGGDILNGGQGGDTLHGDGVEGSMVFTLNGQSMPVYTFGEFHGADILSGDEGNDFLYGDGGADELYGGDDDDQLVGDNAVDKLPAEFHGDDWLEGGAGNDQLWGYGGKDTLFGGEDNDRLEGDAAPGVLPYAQHADDYLDGGAGADVLVGGGADDVLYGGEGDDELAGDGDDMPEEFAGDDYLDGEGGSDLLLGNYGNDILVAGAGDDTLAGGRGDDLYEVQLGDGADTIIDGYGENTVRFGAGITAASLTLQQGVDVQGLGYLVVNYSAGDSLAIQGGFNGVQAFEFADGRKLSPFALYWMLGGTSALPTVTGTAGDDVLATGPLSVVASGGAGADTYQVSQSSGWSTISDQLGSEGDRVQFDAALAPDQVRFKRRANGDLDLEMLDAVDGAVRARVTIAGQYSGATRIESFEFGDGTVIAAADLDSLALAELEGTAADDELTGHATQGQVFVPGAGNDLLAGGIGDDAYRFARGGGADTITDAGGVDTVEFGLGIERDALFLERRVNDDLVLTLDDGSSITITGQYADAASPRVDEIVFADGTSLDAQYLATVAVAPVLGTEGGDALAGGQGDDVLYGFGGADALEGGAGDDTLAGGEGEDELIGGIGDDFLAGEEGADTYRLSFGSGRDLLLDASAETNRIVLDASLGFGALRTSRQGDDLQIAIRGTTDAVIVADYFAQAQSWSIEDEDGATRTPDALLAETAAIEADQRATLKLEYLASEKAAFITSYLAAGYHVAGDGVAKRDYYSPAYANWSVADQTTQRTYYYNDGSSGTSTWSDHFQSWQYVAGAYAEHYTAQFETQVLTSDAASISSPVFGFDNDYSNEGTWYALSWTAVISNPVVTSSWTSTGFIYNSTGGILGTYQDSVSHTSRTGASVGAASEVPSGVTPYTAPFGTQNPPFMGSARHHYTDTRTLHIVNGGDSDNYIWGGALVDAGGGNDTVYAHGGGLVFGGDGNDTLGAAGSVYGDAGDDVLEFGSALYGGAGDDILHGAQWYGYGEEGPFMSGGQGSDLLLGYGGADRYAFAAGEAGVDLVVDRGHVDESAYTAWFYAQRGIEWFYQPYLLEPRAPGALDHQAIETLADAQVLVPDVVEFAAGVALSGLEFSWGEALVDLGGEYGAVRRRTLDIAIDPNQTVRVVVANSTDPIGTGVEGFFFHGDSTMRSLQDLLALAPQMPDEPLNEITGTAAADELYGSRYPDLLQGLGGNDRLGGNEGADRYAIGAGEGIDLVEDGANQAEAYLDWYYEARGLFGWRENVEEAGRWRARFNGEGPYYEYFDTYEEAAASGYALEIVQIQPLADLAPLVTRNDTAIFEQLIQDGVIERDVVAFGEGLSLADMVLTVSVPGGTAAAHPEQPWYEGGRLSLRWTGGGIDLEVPGVTFGMPEGGDIGDYGDYRLGEGIEAFEFADGTTYSLEQLLELATVVPVYDLEVARYSGEHVLDPAEYTGIAFEPGISASEVWFSVDGTDMWVYLNDGSASVRIPGWFANPPQVPDVSVHFAGDATITAQEISDPFLTYYGTANFDYLVAELDGFPNKLYGEGSGDTLQGASGDDLLVGGTGDDYLIGGEGGDTYAFAAGDGSDRVIEEEGGGADTVVFGAGIASGDVSVGREYGDLRLVYGDGDEVLLQGWFEPTGGSVERIEFADGTAWDAAYIDALFPPQAGTPEDYDELLGTSGNDVLAGLEGEDMLDGFGGDDVLDGGPGLDSLAGGYGDDTYLVNAGEADDDIYEVGGFDRLVLGSGIAPSDLTLIRDPWSLYITGPGDFFVSLSDWFEPDSRVEEIHFADGTVWDEAAILGHVVPAVPTADEDILMGTDGDDVIDALAGNDSVFPLMGNDVVLGGAGDDYADKRGGGNAVLFGGADSDSLGGADGQVLLIGGAGEDWLSGESGTALIAFNAGDGVDSLFVNPELPIVVSIGGASAAELTFSRPGGGGMALSVGAGGDVLHLDAYGWASWIWPQGTLQIIGDDIRTYDLNAVVQAYFDAGTPDGWSLSAALDANLLSQSTTEALGGDLAYRYAMTGSLAGLSAAQMQAVLGDPDFGLAAQAVSPITGNAAPEVANAIADQSANEDAAFAFAVPADAFADPDAGDTLTYTVGALPSWLSFDAETGMFTGTPVQADVGSVEVTVTATDGGGLSAEDTFSITVNNVNDAPVVSASNATVLNGASAAAASLFSVADEDGTAPAQYELWDSTAGNGHWAVNGVEQGVNVGIAVSAADLASTVFVGGSAIGSDQVWVRAYDGEAWSAWKSWTMNSWPHATNAAPVVSAGNVDLLLDDSAAAASLFSVTDAEGDAIVQYELWDDVAGGGYFSVGGVAQSNNPIPVSAAQLADVSYVAGSEPGTEQVWVRASDGMSWSAWKAWNMTSALHVPNAAPTITATATQTVTLGQAVDAATLFAAADADGDPIQRYEFWDSTAGNGHFTVDGAEQGVNVGIVVDAVDLADAQFVGASSSASDLVWVRASDGQSWGEWKSWTMNSWPHATNAAPVASAGNASVLTNQVVAASSLFSVTDADGDAMVRYELWDDISGGGYWRLNGVQQGAAQAIAVSAAELASTEYVGGASGGTEQVWVRANDGLEWGAWEAWNMTTALHIPNAVPVVTAGTSTVLLGQSVDASSLFSVADADSDPITQYQFWDSTAGNGHFSVDGVQAGVNVAIPVTAAQLAATQFTGSASTGSDLVWVRAFDGQDWSSWKSWNVNSWPHATNAAPVVAAANNGLLRGEALAAASLFSTTDADGDAATRYEFWDDVNGGGHWAVDGVQQAAAQAIAVEAADLAEVQYVGGANAGTEQVWVRAYDGMGWSAWKNWLMATEGGMLRGGLGPDSLTGEAGPTVLEGGGGNDTIVDTEGNNAVSGGEGDDDITTGDGNDIIVGGAGNDTVHTGGGSNVIAFNSGSGIDTIYSAAGASNTLSFGGGIGYDDLSLSKDGNDLIVSAGGGDAMVLKDWYAGQNNVLNLQIVHDASDEFDAGSTDPLYNRKVQTFDFLGLVGAFDQALAASPGLTSWAVTNALLQFHLSGADDAALGGDLAYWYGRNGSLAGISLQAAQQVIGASGFGSDAQALRPFSGLQEGFVKLS